MHTVFAQDQSSVLNTKVSVAHSHLWLKLQGTKDFWPPWVLESHVHTPTQIHTLTYYFKNRSFKCRSNMMWGNIHQFVPAVRELLPWKMLLKANLKCKNVLHKQLMNTNLQPIKSIQQEMKDLLSNHIEIRKWVVCSQKSKDFGLAFKSLLPTEM